MPGRSRYVVHLQGAPIEVVIEADGRATIDGESYEVVQSGDGRMLVRKPGSPSQTLVSLAGAPRPVEAQVEGQRVTFDLQTAAEAALDAALGGAAGAGGDGQIRAPMPGRVVKVLVAPGDVVEAGGPVVIVEAMKMENELMAPISGAVETVEVAAGDAVEAGALLVALRASDAE